ncbi:MAG: hypothetical protein GXP62_20695 [Oligoflexia bacterium]|nr:hypothetical protein [Oligoflexia bacterium]
MAPPVALMIGLVAILGVLVARVDRVTGAVLVATAAAPIWLAGLGLPASFSVGMPAPGPLSALLLVLAICLAVGAPKGTPLPRSIRLGIILLGSILAVRSVLVGPVLVHDPAVGGALFCGALVVAGCAAVPGRGLLVAALTVAVAAGLAGWRGLERWADAPTSTRQVGLAFTEGVLGRHDAALADQAALGLYAVALQPKQHPLALALVRRMGVEPILDAGWRPEGASLGPKTRVAVALSLDRRSRGGEGLRLCWRGRADPVVAWTGALLARDQGQPELAARLLEHALVPSAVPRLPGRIVFDQRVVAGQTWTQTLHFDQDLAAVLVETVGPPDLPPTALDLRVDSGPWQRQVLPRGPGIVTLQGPFPRGPHRLRVRLALPRPSTARDLSVRLISVSAR